ncbi:MAG TPA: 3-methyl-2-oxobutanoate hydroxymethyltransferase [Holophaga sp.]|jgi:3-methyl-2-oxobutanoate hydroxymethyltransferase|nr:3-methyl-2-oxobutanoate hydroxymethyltransferase [Holophaga sp.]
MSHDSSSSQCRRVTIPELRRKVAQGQKISMITAYDAAMARIADAAGVDLLLIGDSVGNVCLGFDSTLPVTMAMMNHHLEAVTRQRPRAMVIADLPYLSYHASLDEAIHNGGGFMQRGAQAVKLEGGAKRIPVVKALVDAEVPVMGHLGLTPQSVNVMGGYKVQGREGADAIQLIEDALRLQDAGCFSVLMEGIPADLAARVTEVLEVPTIGIGAGPHCSGQVLVFHDLLGLIPGPSAKFVRQYLDGFGLMTSAISNWISDIQNESFPAEAESYMLPEAARLRLAAWRPQAEGQPGSTGPKAE